MTSDPERFPERPPLPVALREILHLLEAEDGDGWCWNAAGEQLPMPADDDGYDMVHENLEMPIRRIICKHEGHRMVQDQCGRREHDLCLICLEQREFIEAKP